MNLEQLIKESTNGVVTIPCTDCRKPITRTKSVMQTSLRRKQTRFFCSNECYQSNNRTLREKTCIICNKVYVSNYKSQKYCGSSCAAKGSNELRKQRGEFSYKLKPNLCTRCGNRINKRCNKECERAKRVDLWLAGEVSGKTTYTITTFAREYIFNRDNHKCTECGFSGSNPVTGNSILHVDHIDGNWENSSEDNLRLLCPNCHAMTDNFGALNMGRGRKWKEKYTQY